MPLAAEPDALDSFAPREPRALHRIGAVSRLAAVPVTTLRVWETRYAAFAPSKTAGSHRLYDDADVARARVLRQLTERGHSIGGIARLPLDDLQRLLERTREAEARTAPTPPDRQVTAVVVGAALAARLDAPGVQEAVAAQLRVAQVYADLDEADADETPAAGAGGKVVLLARMNVVHDAHHAQLLRLIERSGATGAVVLYNYGAPPALEALRAAGLVVRREPVPAPDFAQLIRSMLYVGVPAGDSEVPGALIPRRRFSDATLARVAEAKSSVLCECPRHIAELIGQLASFEEYSHACLNDSAEDARLHAHLRAISGSARAMFERALEVAAEHGGITLD